MPELLTATLIKSLPTKSSRYVVSDTKVSGLGLMIYPSGIKTFVYRYRLPKCRSKKTIPIGKANILSVSDARASAKNLAAQVSKGSDPDSERKEVAIREKNKEKATNLQLYNYIDKYYEPYAKKHSVTADVIVRLLKNNFAFIKHKRIDKIDSMDIEKWRDIRANDGITFETFKRIFTYLKACLNAAIKHYKLIESFNLQNYTLKKRMTDKVNPPKLRYLLKDEEERLLLSLSERDRDLRGKINRGVERKNKKAKKKLYQPIKDHEFPDHITPITILAYHTGLDLGDLFDLDWELHIDFRANQIRKFRNKTIHKATNPKLVVIPMSKTVKEILTQWGRQHGKEGRVFKSPVTGGRLDNIKKAWEGVRKKAGLEDFRFKDFRHTFGSWLAIDGWSLITSVT